MPYARLLYHVVWATKHRPPSITEAREAIIRASIAATSKDMDLAVYGVGIMPDHVHVFAQISPTLTVARVIGRWKGASSHAVNAEIPDAQDLFAWQEGYGVISVSQRGLIVSWSMSSASVSATPHAISTASWNGWMTLALGDVTIP